MLQFLVMPKARLLSAMGAVIRTGAFSPLFFEQENDPGLPGFCSKPYPSCSKRGENVTVIQGGRGGGAQGGACGGNLREPARDALFQVHYVYEFPLIRKIPTYCIAPTPGAAAASRGGTTAHCPGKCTFAHTLHAPLGPAGPFPKLSNRLSDGPPYPSHRELRGREEESYGNYLGYIIVRRIMDLYLVGRRGRSHRDVSCCTDIHHCET